MKNPFEGNLESKPERQEHSYFMTIYMQVNRRQLALLHRELSEMNMPVSDMARILRLPEELLRNDGVREDEI